ncbi:MAG: hypothetical protein IPH58_04595 [Sphingobacteriales bacterium]|jgi:hypothetical protein|nr:hypothetical protein [Sphingobacteriales bacterium]
MQHLLNDIANSFLSKSFSDCSLEDVKSLCDRYPYSSSAQILFAQKLKETGSPDYEDQWQKTLLYFDNPLLINYLFTIKPAVPHAETKKSEEKIEDQVEDLQVIEKEKVIDSTAEISEKEEVKIPQLKIEPIDPAINELTFTPYYTLDYFASQGIKLCEEQRGNDRFGKQLMSFTAWLKQMRRLPEAEAYATYTLKVDRKVVNMAEKSVSGENAITEAMAQVWVKQKEISKAIEVFQKLSLLNPAKSAYFAAKMDYLKKML